MKRLIILLTLSLISIVSYAQINTRTALRAQVYSSSGTSPNFNVQILTADDLSKFDATNVSKNDLLYVIDGADCWELRIDTVYSAAGTLLDIGVTDITNTLSSVPSGQAAIVSPYPTYNLPFYVSSLRDDLQSCILQKLVTRIDSITAGTGSQTLSITGYDLNISGGNTVTIPSEKLNYPLVYNGSGVEIKKGQVVMIDTTQIIQGDKLRVIPAIATTSNTEFIVGVANQNIPINTEGYILWFGQVTEVNHTDIAETGITLIPGNILYISVTEPGKFTNVKPPPPYINSTIALLERKPSSNNMTLLVRPWLNEKLGDIYDVSVTGAINNSVLKYNNTTKVWEASTSPVVLFSDTATIASKQWVISQGYGTLNGVNVTAPLQTTGGNTPTLSIPLANSTTSGYLSLTDWGNFKSAYDKTITGVTMSAGTLTLTARDNTTLTANYTDAGLTSVGITPPIAGISVSGSPLTANGSITLSLSNDLAALEALNATGIAVRTGIDTWVVREITAGSGITITNGTGVSGNISIAHGTHTGDVTGSTALTVVKIQGREVSSATPSDNQILKWSAINNRWELSEDQTGAPGTNDGVVSSIAVTGTTEKTITLTRTNSLPNLTATFTDLTGSYTAGSGIDITGNVISAVDVSATNEVQTLSASGTTSPVISLSQISGTGGGNVTLNSGGIVSLNQNANTITISATEVDGSTTNEIQSLTLTNQTLGITGGNSVSLPIIDVVAGNGITVSKLAGVATVSAVDASATNELQTLSVASNVVSLSNSGGSVTIGGSGIASISTTGNTITVNATETDGSVSNEGSLSVGTGLGNTSLIQSNTSGSPVITLAVDEGLTISETTANNTITLSNPLTARNTTATGANVFSHKADNLLTFKKITGDGIVNVTQTDSLITINGTETIQSLNVNSNTVTLSGTGAGSFTIAGAGTNTISTAGSTITITGTEVDGSTTNELQTISAATNQITLSNSGGSVTIAGAGTNTVGTVGNTITVTGAEVDGNVSNEGVLGVSAGTGTTSVITSNTSGANGVTISAGTGIGISETTSTNGGTITVTNNAPDQTVSIAAGTGISTSGTYPNFTVTNNAPDQTVSISGAGINAVTGTYPNFTVTATEVDGNVENEGKLSVLAGTETTSVIRSSTANSTDVTITAGSGLSISETGNVITLTNTAQNTNQTLSLTGQSLSISSGNSVTLPLIGVTAGTGITTSVTSGNATINLASGYGDTQNPYASKNANLFLASPNSTAGVPTFRSIVAADIPTLNQNTTGTASNVTGTVAVANGGTGATSLTGVLIGNGTSAVTGLSATAGSQLLRRNSTNDGYEFWTPNYVTSNIYTSNGNITGTRLVNVLSGSLNFVGGAVNSSPTVTVNSSNNTATSLRVVHSAGGDLLYLLSSSTTPSVNKIINAEYYDGINTIPILNLLANGELTLNKYGTGANTGTLAYVLGVTSTGKVIETTTSVHDAVTLGTANGLSLSGQQLSLGLASTSTTGALSSTDWNTFNNKQSTISLTTNNNSGAATFTSNTLNIPNYTLSGLGGEPTITAGTTTQYWRGDKTWQTLNTTAVTEGTNLYFTNTRARDAISLTTTGSSGAATYSAGVFNIPNYTLAGLGGLSNSTSSTQNGYFGDIFLYDDTTPSHYLQITNSANLTAQRILSVNVNDADRTISLSGNLTVSGNATVSGTNTGDQTITLTGDVTGSGTGSFATTLANTTVVPNTYTAATITVDSKGRITSASSNTIPTVNNGTLTLNVSGTGLSGSQTFTANQSTNATFTVTSNATSANTASTIVARDASGNFTAGTITGALSGNATTASTLQTARTIQTNLASTSASSFNGSANITPGVTGTLPIGNGGTGGTTAATAIQNLLPSYTSNNSKVLALNSTATALEWITPTGGTGGIGGTGIANKLAFFTDASTLSTNTNLHWDNNNEILGIGTNAPTTGVTLTVLAKESNAIAQSIRGRTDGIGVLMFTDNANAENGRLDFRTNYAAINVVRNAPFVIATNNTERMRITATGNVGIGTASPNDILSLVRTGNDPVYVSYNNGTVNTLTGTSGGGVNAVTLFGNTTNHPIAFFANNTEKMRITATGNVGIGTTSPSSILSLSGDAAQTFGMERHTTANTGGNNLTIQAGGATSGATDKFGGALFLSSGTSTGNQRSVIVFSTPTPGTSGTADNAPVERVRINNTGMGIGTNTLANTLDVEGGAAIGATYSGTNAAPSNGLIVEGNVGIGTNNPIAKLNLVSGEARLARFIGNNSNNYIELSDNNGTNTVSYGSISGGNSYTFTQGYHAVYTGGAERFRFTSSGFLGIGTNNPTNILSLNGNAARTIWMERHTTANTEGNNLTIQAGGATSTATNQNGGNLILESGTATGTGSSSIIFETSTAGVVPTADNTPTEKMRIDGLGNVGIGTTAPTAFGNGVTLQVGSTTSKQGILLLTNGTINYRSQVTGSLAYTGTTSNHGYVIQTNNTNRVTIQSDGKVGINTNAPATTLSVNGAISTSVPVAISTNNYTIPETGMWFYITTSSVVNINLPTASTYPGRIISIKTIETGSSDITVSGNVIWGIGGHEDTNILFKGATKTNGSWKKLVSNGTRWIVMEASGSGN